MRQQKGMSMRERRRRRQGTPGRPLQRTLRRQRQGALRRRWEETLRRGWEETRRRRTGAPGAIVLAALACCLLPSGAAAKHVIAPPGNAGVEQYVEVVPGAAGNEPVDGHSGKGDALSQSTERHLQALGPEGEAAAAFAQATGSAKSHKGNAKHGKRPHHGSSATSPAGGGGNGGGSAGGHGGGQHLTKAAGGGIGIGLPLALALIALLALAGALLRRRSLPS